MSMWKRSLFLALALLAITAFSGIDQLEACEDGQLLWSVMDQALYCYPMVTESNCLYCNYICDSQSGVCRPCRAPDPCSDY